MLLWENIKLAIHSLLSNKARSLLTMLGIIIGIAAVIAILTVGESLTMVVSENMQSMGANDIFCVVEPREAKEENGKIDGVTFGKIEQNKEITSEDCITNEMIDEMCKEFKDEIYAISLQHSAGTGKAVLDNKNANVKLQGVSIGNFIGNKFEMISGHIFQEQDLEDKKNVCLVSDILVDNLFGGNNDYALGKEIEVVIGGKADKFAIIGVYEYKTQAQMVGMGFSAGENATTEVYVPLKAATAFDHSENVYSLLQIISNVNTNPEVLAKQIENFFEPYYKSNRNFNVRVDTMSAMIDMVTTMMDTEFMAISLIAGIALIVGGIGVMNIMLVSITERTKEIGIRKALGAKNISIRTQFIVEAMIICLIGGLIGVIFGVSAGIGLSNLLGYPARPSVSAIVISLLFSMTVGVFFGYYPANKAAKMNPIDALRYE